DGTTYAPKYFPCAVASCLGNNLDTSDPGTQAYVKAMDKKIFDDINKGATAVLITNPVGATGTLAGIAGPLSSIASGMINEEVDKAGLKELTQAAASQYLQRVFGIAESAANRVTALVDLSGGW